MRASGVAHKLALRSSDTVCCAPWRTNTRPAKAPRRAVVHHVLIQLAARATPHAVVDERIVVHMLLLVGNHTSVEVRLRPFAGECHVRAVARQSVVQCEIIKAHHAVALLVDIHIAETAVLHVRLFQFVQFQMRVLPAKTSTIWVVRKSRSSIAWSQNRRRACAPSSKNHQHTAVHHQADIRAQEVHHLYRALHRYAARHVDKQSVLCQHGVQRVQRVLPRAGQPAIAGLHLLREFLGRPTQGAHHHARRQGCRGRAFSQKASLSMK